MLKLLRKHSRSWLIALTVGAIVVVFIFWGAGTMRSPQFQEAASVNGTPIPMTDFIRQYTGLVKQYQERSGGELTDEMIKAMHLKELALNRLIDETLLVEAAARLGLTVSDAELRQDIQSYPAFQKNGKFDQKRYFWILTQSHFSPPEFEKQERQRLLIQKVVDEVTSYAKVSDLELADYYRLGKESVAVDYLEVPSARFVDKQNPRDAEVARYYQDNQNHFQDPVRARVKYLSFRIKDFLNRVEIPGSEANSYLKEHQEEFTQPKVIRVRQLFLKLSPQATAAEKQQVEKQAMELWSKAMRGADFAVLVRASSQDEASKEKGGELGDVTRGQHPPQWDRVAFSLKPGLVGRAVTPQGIYLIKVEEIKETEPVPDAAEKVSKRLKEEKAKVLAREAAHEARSQWFGASSVPKAATKYGIALQETPLISLRDPVPGQGVIPKFNQAALDLKPGAVSQVLDLPGGFAVLKGVEHRPETLPPLAQIKDQVRQALKQEMAQKQAEKEAGGLLAQLKKGKTLAQVAAEAGLTVKDSGYFTRYQGFLQQPTAAEMNATAFQLSARQPYPAHPLFQKGNYYLLAFKGRRSPDPAELKKEMDKFRDQFLQQKRQMVFDSWLHGERQRAQIKIYGLP